MTPPFFVYVAAPFDDGAIVRDCLHDRLRLHGMRPTAQWFDAPRGPEDFTRFSPDELQRRALRNDADVRGSDVVFALPRRGAGGEMFAEIRVALEWGKSVVWVGERRTLSAWRAGVVRVDDFDAGLGILCAMRDQHARGIRGQLLAHMVGSAA